MNDGALFQVDTQLSEAAALSHSRRGVMVSGISHHRTSIALREKLAIGADALKPTLDTLAKHYPGNELVLVATCNRVELYVAGREDPATATLEPLIENALLDSKQLALYHHEGRAAVNHLFRVAAGLDSLVVGEDQILGQLKDAYLVASELGTTGRVLNALFQAAFRVGKLVRSQTRISEGRVSVGGVAVAFAQRIFSQLESKTALVLGAGETASLVIEHLFGAGLDNLIVASRSPERAASLVAAYHGEWVPLSTIDRHFHRADIVIGSTAAPQPVASLDLVRSALMRRSQPQLLLDLAVPRDIDPRVTELEGVFLYCIDDLQEVVVETLGLRQQEAEAAARIVEQEVSSCSRMLAEQDAGPLLTAIRARAALARDSELQALFARIELTSLEREQVERLAHRLVNHLIHPQLLVVREAAAMGQLDWIGKLLAEDRGRSSQ
jgi:glutamyl-tRNA reductase